MKDDFGYFGSGLEGYVQYNEAFKRNFDNSTLENTNEDKARNATPGDDNFFGGASDINCDPEEEFDDDHCDLDVENEGEY